MSLELWLGPVAYLIREQGGFGAEGDVSGVVAWG